MQPKLGNNICDNNAQTEYDNEIAIAYGGGANTDIVSSIAKGMFTGKQTSYWGPISAEYFHRLNNNRVGIGGVFVVSGCKFDDSKDSKSTYHYARRQVQLVSQEAYQLVLKGCRRCDITITKRWSKL